MFKAHCYNGDLGIWISRIIYLSSYFILQTNGPIDDLTLRKTLFLLFIDSPNIT